MNVVQTTKDKKIMGLGMNEPSNSILYADKISKTFGNQTVVQDVSLSVEQGDRIAIIGRSGSGKSTFLRCLNLLEMPSQGRLLYNGSVMADASDAGRSRKGVGASRKELLNHRKRVGMVFQRFELFPHLSAIQNVALGPRRSKGLSKEESMEIAKERLNMVGLGAREDAKPNQLSGGQQQRVAIARSLAMDPKVMLFDEPTSALDPELVDEVLATMQDLAALGMTMIVVTHEIRFAVSVADKMLVFDDGRIVERGAPKKVAENPESDATKALLRAFRASQ